MRSNRLDGVAGEAPEGDSSADHEPRVDGLDRHGRRGEGRSFYDLERRERLGVYSLRVIWGLVLPAAVAGGLLGKLVMWGLARELDLRILDAARLARQPLYWGGTFLEQTLDELLAPAAIDRWPDLYAPFTLLLYAIVLIAHPAGNPPVRSESGGRFPRRYASLYHRAIMPTLAAFAATTFATHTSTLISLAAFLLLEAIHLAYLIVYPRDLVVGGLARRFSYLLVAMFFLALVLVVPYRYGRTFFDVEQPPLVESAKRLGAFTTESFERSGQMTVVVDPAGKILASIQLSKKGKLVSLVKVQSFAPRPQPRNLRELVTNVEASELHDVEAIAARWVD